MGQNAMGNNKKNKFLEFMILNTSNTLLLNIEVIAFYVSSSSVMLKVHFA